MENRNRKDFKIKKPPAPLNGKTLSRGYDGPGQEEKYAVESSGLKNLKPNDYTRYTHERRLGQGGVANVNSGLDTNLDRQVAIKLLKPEFCNDEQMQMRFVREAKIMAMLEHPNIVPIHEVGTRANCLPYFTMKQLSGVTLQEIIFELAAGNQEFHEKYSQAFLLRAFIQICQAIAFAHSLGILHRDLKPSNIQLGEYGEVYVMDWGLAKKLGTLSLALTKESGVPSAPLDSRMLATTEGSISGTPLYMSPEQANGCNSSLDERSDVYSLGAILYEILTLHTAIPAEEPRKVFRHVRNGTIVPPRRRYPERNIPPELDAIVMRALATDLNERYSSAPILLHDLERYIDSHPISVYRASLPLRFWKFCKRNALLSSTIAASATVALILSASFLLVGKVKRQVYLNAGEKQLLLVRKGRIEWRKTNTLLETVKMQSNPSKDPASLRIELKRKRNELLNHIDLGIHMLSQAGLRHEQDGKCRLSELNKYKIELLAFDKNSSLDRATIKSKGTATPVENGDGPEGETVNMYTKGTKRTKGH